jgi:hypothetical protein
MNVANKGMGSINANVALNDNRSSMRSFVFVALALWLGLVFVLGSRGAFVGRLDSPPLPIFFGLATPLVLFFGAYFGWSAFREFILGADLRLVTAIQGWRWAGLGFIWLYAHGVLPGLFALPAGLGDMAIGVTAPWILLNLIRHPSFVTSRRYVMWHVLGILDFVIAVSMAVICSGLFRGLKLSVTTSAMDQLPLVLVPAYLVPLFVMLHFTALAQVKRAVRIQKTK